MERAVPYQVLRHAPSAKSSYPSNFPTSRDTRGASASHSELDVRTFSSKTWLELFPVRLTRDRQRSSLCWGADTRYSESFLDTSCDPPAFRLSLQPLQRHLDVRRHGRRFVGVQCPIVQVCVQPCSRNPRSFYASDCDVAITA